MTRTGVEEVVSIITEGKFQNEGTTLPFPATVESHTPIHRYSGKPFLVKQLWLAILPQ